MPRHARLTALLTLAAALLAAPAATAGTYTVHSCTTPTGAFTTMEGWTTSASEPVVGEDPGTPNNCTPVSKVFGLEYGDAQSPVSAGKWLRWTFTPPTATSIRGVTVLRSFELGWLVEPGLYGRPFVYDAWHDDDVSFNQLEFFFPPFGGDTVGMDFDPLLEQTDVEWGSFNVRLRCWELTGNNACGPYRAHVAIPRATFELADTSAPVGSVEGGSLVAGGAAVRGVGTLAFHATDVGAGVYRAIVSVDGEEVVRGVIDGNGGRCADVEPATGSAYEFGTPQPCPASADGEVQLSTAALADGSHALQLAVEDASGNVDVVFDGTVVTHNAPIATAIPTLSGTARVGGKLTAAKGEWDGAPTGYGYRWLRCDANGGGCAGIPGASAAAYAPTAADAYHRLKVEVVAENAAGAAAATSAASARVQDADGNATPPASSSGASAPSLGGIQGLVNPLAGAGGHVANGANAAPRARIEIGFRLPGGRLARRVTSTRDRSWTIAGRLVAADGGAIGGARLGVAWMVQDEGWVARGVVRTRADGRFAYTLPAGPSRQVKLTYFAYSDSEGFVASNVIREDVRAPLTLRADGRRLATRRVVRLSGRVGGGTIPRGGVLVTLQGFQAGWGWRTFRTVRTGRDGRWRTSYRFRLAYGRFGFRAVVPRQSGHPYLTTRSKPVYVTVG